MCEKNYWRLQKFSFFFSFYAYIDSTDYLADQLFIKHMVRVGFGNEYGQKDSDYLIIFCKVRKRNEKEFTKALNELENKMLLTGHRDYTSFCEKMKEKLVADKSKSKRRFFWR